MNKNYDIVNNKDRIGHLGQHYVMTEFLKNNIECLDISMRKMKGVCDIITEGFVKIEVKTSVYKKDFNKGQTGIPKSGWGFNFVNRAKYDFLVLVLLEPDKSVYKMLCFPYGKIKGQAYCYFRPDETMPIGTRGSKKSETKVSEEYQGLRLIYEYYKTL